MILGLSGRTDEANPLSDLPFKGELEGIGLPAILRSVHEHERTGTLLVESDEGSIRIYFENGHGHALFRLVSSRHPDRDSLIAVDRR